MPDALPDFWPGYEKTERNFQIPTITKAAQ